MAYTKYTPAGYLIREELLEFAGSSIPVISATDLTVFKTLFKRPQDWVDITEMLKAGTVDGAEALRCAEHLGGIEAGDRLGRAIGAAIVQGEVVADQAHPPKAGSDSELASDLRHWREADGSRSSPGVRWSLLFVPSEWSAAP